MYEWHFSLVVTFVSLLKLPAKKVSKIGVEKRIKVFYHREKFQLEHHFLNKEGKTVSKSFFFFLRPFFYNIIHLL
jgi:hypothetical protein